MTIEFKIIDDEDTDNMDEENIEDDEEIEEEDDDLEEEHEDVGDDQNEEKDTEEENFEEIEFTMTEKDINEWIRELTRLKQEKDTAILSIDDELYLKADYDDETREEDE